jgi:UDP-glucose 4-epimerase
MSVIMKKKIKKYYKNSIERTLNLVNVCKRSKVRTIIFLYLTVSMEITKDQLVINETKSSEVLCVHNI